jgi:hypothetical protein
MIFQDANGDSSDKSDKGSHSAKGSSGKKMSGSKRGFDGSSRGSTSSGFSGGSGSGDDPKRPRKSIDQNDTGINFDIDDDEEEAGKEEEDEEPVFEVVGSSNPGTPENVANPLSGISAVDVPNPAADVRDIVPAVPNLAPAAAAVPNLPAAAGQNLDPAIQNPDPAIANPAPAIANPAPAIQNPAEHIEGNTGWLSYKDLMATTYPAKSRKIYLSSYASFEKYLRSKGQFNPDLPPTELSCMNYFHHLREDKKWKCTTLWSHFSRVNAVTKRTWGMNLAKLPSMTGLLKAYETGHRVKKASVFSPQQAS